MNNGSERAKTSRPNLFDYATSELSQDAFFIWLFRYADPQFQDDFELHRTAQKFVSLFLDDYSSPIKEIKVWKQWANIDITVEVNGAVGIIIEDKVGAHLHGDQLRRYREAAEKWAKDEHLRLGFFYLNTENPNTDDRENIKKEQYKMIKRSELLRILNGYSGANPILCDFRDKLSIIESETEAYKMRPFNTWTFRAWQGFYDWIHSIRSDSTWDWLNPPSGAFLGMWWNNHGEWINGEVALYPQIDQGRFTFKMYCENDSNKEWGYRLRNSLEEIAHEFAVDEIHRPARLSFKGYATALLVVEPEEYLGTGNIDLNAVIKKFELYEKVIEMCKARFRTK